MSAWSVPPKLIAFHEAGHAVAYLRSRRSFRYVTIRPRTAGLAGVVKIRPGGRIDAMLMAIVSHAGPVAQGMRTLETYRPGELDDEGVTAEDVFTDAYQLGGQGDVDNVNSLLPVLGESGCRRAAKIARELLTDEWAAVRSVAEALLDRGTLSHRDVVEVAG